MGDVVKIEEYWLYYHTPFEACAFCEGPFPTLTEARIVAHEIDEQLYPLVIWVQSGPETLWHVSRLRASASSE